MSHEVISAVIRGATGFVNEAQEKLTAALAKHGPDKAVSFPETAFYLPMACALMGIEAKKLSDLGPIVEHCKEILPPEPANKLWMPYLGNGLDAGAATLLSSEVTCALRYLEGEKIEDGFEGFMSDTVLRELGIQLVDGRMPGFAAILGPAPSNEIAVSTIRELQKRSILSFIIANSDGKSMFDQLTEEGVEMGWSTYIVPVGRDTHAVTYVLDWAMRGALTFGGHQKGDFTNCLKYCRDRIFAFAITFGSIPDDWYAMGAGAILMGFPVISDSEATPEVRPTGVTLYEALVHETDYSKLVSRCIEVRGVQVKVEEVDIPVSYAAAFEGERVRREDMQLEFGGKYSAAVELLRMREMNEVEDGKIELIGSDIDTCDLGGAMDLAVVIDVAGRKMQLDFEGILERQVHTYLNHAMGIMHTGQRDIIWMRISKSSFDQGFRLEHFGKILISKLHEGFAGIVDKASVTIYTDKKDVEKIIPQARKAFDTRDDRIAGMSDESVDLFYSCTICQSYAPNHVCVITPERLGLCGAYNWLDGKAAYEINSAGPNQPIKKGNTVNEKMGEWEGVNNFVYDKSNRTVDHFSAYSLLENPMTSCGCFECILAIVPEANGVMIVNREYPGDTPIGMPFSTLAGSVGGGAQTPGFLGVGRLYLTSKKFILGEGGLGRLVWMPKELKEAMRERLSARAKEAGLGDDFVDKIADDTICTDSEGLMEFLTKAEHPAMAMEALF